jgi:hypothetical protein
MRGLSICLLAPVCACAAGLPLGSIIDDVKCAANPQQSYALYVPSSYQPDQPSSVIFAFDPGARGKTAVERFAAGAEKYGYIVAGSNNSRNGSWERSLEAISAMSADVGARLAVNEKRIYTAGMSGGSRVALQVALGTGRIAGVIASSAGWPDSKPRKTAPFVVFGTAGTEDFNYLEMRQLDRTLTTPHRVVIFEGGHTWLSSDLGVEAIEWMELQAMKSGLRAKDEKLIAQLYDTRLKQARSLSPEFRVLTALESMQTDFSGLRDVSEIKMEASALRKQKAVKDGIKRDRADLDKEERQRATIGELEDGLRDPSRMADSLTRMKDLIRTMAKEASAPDDSDARRMARRLLRGTAAGARETGNAELRKLLDSLGISARPRG